jgi:hypothetical protein
MSDTATTTATSEPVRAPDAEPGAPGEQPAVDGGPEQAGEPKKKMSRKARVRLFVILGLALLVAVAFGVRYLVDTSNYVTTDNAQVDGNQISVNAPTSASRCRAATCSPRWSSGHPRTGPWRWTTACPARS